MKRHSKAAGRVRPLGIVWLATWIGAMTILSLPGRAHAQLLPNAAYEDIKSVIEELLTEELAHSIVPNVACLSGRREAKEAGAEGPYPFTLDGKRYRLELVEVYPRSLQNIYNRRFAALKTSIRDESADYAAFTLYGRLVDGDDAAKAVSSKLAGTAEASEADVQYEPLHATKPKLFVLEEETALKTCRESLAEYFDGKATLPASSQLDEACGEQGVTAKRHYACNLSFALRALLQDRAALAEEFLVRATSDVMVEVVKAKAPSAVSDPNAFADALVLELRSFLYTPDASADAFLDKLLHATSPYAAIPGDDVDAKKATLATWVGDMARLKAQWSVATHARTAKLDLASYVETIAASSGYLGSACKGLSSGEVCSLVASHRETLGRTSELWPIVQLASRGEYREVAQRSISAMFQAAESQRKCTGSNCDKLKLYRRFAESVVDYVLASENGSSRSEATREAFRDAATDVIRELGRGGGVDRRWHDWQTLLLPDLALRFSWNPGYVNQDGGGFRTIASMDWMKVRGTLRRSDLMYAALQLSVLDPLAPLNELAIRKKDTTFSDTQYLALNVVNPRFDVLIGAPVLSKHLVLAAGASFRPVTPFAVRAENDPSNAFGGYVYRRAFTKDVDFAKNWPQFVEFGFAVKYLL